MGDVSIAMTLHYIPFALPLHCCGCGWLYDHECLVLSFAPMMLEQFTHIAAASDNPAMSLHHGKNSMP